MPEKDNTTLNNSVGESSTPTTDANKAGASSEPAPPQSLDDVVEAMTAAGDSAPPAETEHEKAPQDGESENENETADEQSAHSAEDEGREEPKSKEGAKEEDTSEKPPPFHEHPAWKRVLAERDMLRPLAERHLALEQYCAANRISRDDLRTMLEVAALIQTDPAKAYEKLAPVVQGLEQLVGVRLPESLEQEVADGSLTPEQAKRLAKLEAEKRLLEAKQQAEQRALAERELQHMVSALNNWIANKQKTDLSFRPRAAGAPVGLWEAVDARYTQLVNQKPPQTPSEAVALAEQAYNDMRPAFTDRVRVPPTKRLRSDKSSFPKEKEPTSLDEVAMKVAGVKWDVDNKF